MERPKCGTCDCWELCSADEEPDTIECDLFNGRIRSKVSPACVHHQDFAQWRELRAMGPVTITYHCRPLEDGNEIAKRISEVLERQKGEPALQPAWDAPKEEGDAD